MYLEFFDFPHIHKRSVTHDVCYYKITTEVIFFIKCQQNMLTNTVIRLYYTRYKYIVIRLTTIIHNKIILHIYMLF